MVCLGVVIYLGGRYVFYSGFLIAQSKIRTEGGLPRSHANTCVRVRVSVRVIVRVSVRVKFRVSVRFRVSVSDLVRNILSVISFGLGSLLCVCVCVCVCVSE